MKKIFIYFLFFLSLIFLTSTSMLFAQISLKDAEKRATKSLRAVSSCYLSLSSVDRERVTKLLSDVQTFYNDAINDLNVSKSGDRGFKDYYENSAINKFIHSDSLSELALRVGKQQAKLARDSGRKGGASCL
jgi:hypothetical protein